MPSQPSRAMAWWKSSGKPPSVSRFSQYAASNFAQILSIAARMASCSSEKEKSMALIYRFQRHAAREHRLDLGSRIARLAQELDAVLPQARRRAQLARRRCGPAARQAHGPQLAFR